MAAASPDIRAATASIRPMLEMDVPYVLAVESSYGVPRAIVPGTGNCELSWSGKRLLRVWGRSLG